MLKTGLCAALLALAVAACGEPAPQPPVNAPATAGPQQPAQPAPTATDPQALTAEGWGPLRIGMTRDEITAALGPDANPGAVGGADPAQCDQYRPQRAPDGMLLMVEGGRLTRISLTRDSQVKTDRGLGLGATPPEVVSAYGAAIRSEPHKYEGPPANYLTVWTHGDGADPASRGIRYEVTGSGKVMLIHAGGPSITYVEGCS